MATVYINADSGSDARTYDEAQVSSTPWLTPAKVFASATDGDTCIVQASTAVFTTGSQTITKAVTFTADTNTTTGHVFAISSNRWTHPTALKMTTFNYIKFTGSGNAAVFRAYGGVSSGFTFNNCWININGGTGAVGGVFYGGDAPSTTTTIKNCRIDGFTAGAKNLFVDAGGYTPLVIMTGCTIYLPAITAFCTNGSAVTSFTIKNCIFYAASSIPFGGTGTGTYSDIYNFTSIPAGVSGGTGVITSDPLFVDAANGNYNLRPSSPCIDSASNT